jgi:probable F420-dependent oxidoreductase
VNAILERIGRLGVWVNGAATGGRSGAADLARAVESIGIGALWVGGGNPNQDALDERALMLDATEQLVVATGIASVWAWDPAALHAATVAIEERHPGRFLLGLGVSHRPNVERLGREYRRPMAEMRALLDGLDQAAAGGGIAPPRVLAALGPKMLELARDRSVGAHPYLVTPEHSATARGILGPDRLLAPEQAVVMNNDAAAARRIARDYLAPYLTLPNYLSNLVRLGFGPEDCSAGGSDRLVDALVPHGDAATVAAHAQEHLDAGADHVCVQPLGEGGAVDLDGLAELARAFDARTVAR